MGLWLVGVPFVAHAQEEEGAEAPAEAAAPAEANSDADKGVTEAKRASTSGVIEEAFPIQRGVFTDGEFGIFNAFGGRNTNDPALPSRGITNVQPYFGITVGYDLVNTPTFNLAAGIKLGMLFNGGGGRVTSNEAADTSRGSPDPTTKPNDFSVLEAGAAIKASFHVLERLAVVGSGEGGMAMIQSDPQAAAATIGDRQDLEGAGSTAFGAMFAVGIGWEFFPLLNGFSVGTQHRFVGILAGGLIPGMSHSVALKFNF